jgi:hypothetical protein
MFTRFARIASGDAKEDGTIRMVASTAEAVDWGGGREILLHDPENIDMSAATGLLLNHDRSMVSGVLRDLSADGKELTGSAVIDEDARLSSGVSVRKAVASGALRGVSIGYSYGEDDAARLQSSGIAGCFLRI